MNEQALSPRFVPISASPPHLVIGLISWSSHTTLDARLLWPRKLVVWDVFCNQPFRFAIPQGLADEDLKGRVLCVTNNERWFGTEKFWSGGNY